MPHEIRMYKFLQVSRKNIRLRVQIFFPLLIIKYRRQLQVIKICRSFLREVILGIALFITWEFIKS